MKRRPFSALRFPAGYAVGLHLVDAREITRDVDIERLEAAGRIELTDDDRPAVAEAIAWVAVAYRLQAKRLPVRALRTRFARARRRGEEAADGPEEAFLAHAAAASGEASSSSHICRARTRSRSPVGHGHGSSFWRA